MADLTELVRVYREQEAAAATEAQANFAQWQKAQADQLEADGWTDLAKAARVQLAAEEAEAAGGYADQTKEDLYAEVQKRGITGMSQANKDELVAALEADDRGELPVEEG